MKVSVILVIFNEKMYIKKCMDALLKQTYEQFEIIVVDNGSNDGTGEIINAYRDERVKYYVERSKCGVSTLRNIGIDKSKGEFIFFTDGDCIPNKYWIEEGLRILQGGRYAGVEGKTYYESANTTISNVVVESYKGFYMTCNIGYKKEALVKVNGFDSNFTYGHEDRDLAIRILKHGEICFSEDMIVVHQKKKRSIRGLFTLAKRAENMVYLFKVNGKGSGGHFAKNILYPNNLLIILFPPLLILRNTYRSGYDFLIAFFLYFACIYERIVIWRAAIRNRIFVL